MHAFFHAVAVFFDHLAAVRWTPLAVALALHFVKLLFRVVAWRNILRAAYPGARPRFHSVFGAYVAGVGINSIAPARGGDLVKLYLVKRRVEGATYPTLAPTLVVETVFDLVVASVLVGWAMTIGVLPTHQVYSRLPTVDWQWPFSHPRIFGVVAAVLAGLLVVLFVWARRRLLEVRAGFAILGRPTAFLRGVVLWQLVSWIFRIGSLYYFLEAFRVHASLRTALLVQVVDSLATLFPATPGGAGTKQGLLVFILKGKAYSRTLLLSFSVGMNIALVLFNVVLGFAALIAMTGSVRWRRVAEEGRSDEASTLAG